jgi:hypothetical protein
MLLFLPVALGQALGGTLYTYNPIYPFILCSAGMVLVAIYAYLKVTDPREIER